MSADVPCFFVVDALIEEVNMKVTQIRLALLVASSAAVTVLSAPAPAYAEARVYQWCANHRGSMECYYSSYQQCQASASGWGICVENPFYRPERYGAPALRSNRG